MSAPTSNEVDRLASLPKPSLEHRLRMSDLPTPPELVSEIEEYCRRFWFWERARFRRSVTNEFKLRWCFGGQHVYYLWTSADIAVISAGILWEGGTHKLREQLSIEERDQLRSAYVFRLHDEEAIV